MNLGPLYAHKPDPAAEFAIALSIYNGLGSRVHETDGLDLSEPFDGGDEFMRVCVLIGQTFEAWACRNVDFDNLTDVWPYLLEDKFLWAYEQAFDPITQENIEDLKDLTEESYRFEEIMKVLWTTQK